MRAATIIVPMGDQGDTHVHAGAAVLGQRRAAELNAVVWKRSHPHTDRPTEETSS